MTENSDNFTETLQKLYRNFTETLQTQHFEVLELICKNKEITTSAMAEKLSVSRQTIANRIKFLQENGFLKRIGGDKGGYWKICIPKQAMIWREILDNKDLSGKITDNKNLSGNNERLILHSLDGEKEQERLL